MVIAGLLGMVSALLAPSAELALGLFTVFLLLAVIATTWYSRKVYFGRKCRKIKSKRASLFVCDERNKTVLRELIFRAEPFGGRKA